MTDDTKRLGDELFNQDTVDFNDAEDFAKDTVDVAIEKQEETSEPLQFDREKPFTFTPPHRCTGCGQKSKNMTPENGKGWLMIPICPGVWLYCCSICHTVHTNQEALFNTKVANVLIAEEQEKRIILPNQQSKNAISN